MARLRTSVERAAALHRLAAAAADAAERGLAQFAPDAAPAQQYARQHELAAALRASAAALAPGWLGAPLDATPPSAPLPSAGAPSNDQSNLFVRVGVAQPLDDAQFPAVVPLGHLAVDADARDARAAGLVRSVLLRLVAAHPAGTLRVRAVDATGTAFAPFAALTRVGVLTGPAADRDALRATLAEAEEWVRSPSPGCRLLLVVATLPELTEAADLAHLADLAARPQNPAAPLHLIVAGWPPPPLTSDTPAQPLPGTTHIALRNPYALVGDPPSGTYGVNMALNSPVYLDEDPPVETIRAICAQVAAQLTKSGSTLAELLPEEPWQESSADGLAIVVGRSHDPRGGVSSLTLRLADLTPHWLIGGHPGAGKSAFLLNVLFGLSTRYGPEELTLYLLDFKDGNGFAEFLPADGDPSWIPQVRAAGMGSERDYGLAVLRELNAELARRDATMREAGFGRFAEWRATTPSPRIVCVIDEYQILVQGNDSAAREALGLLETLARNGRSAGIHLILVSHAVGAVESLYARRDSTFGQFPVRVALPGGADVLEPTNRSAGPLALGQAVVNTAGGLGGPAGASRAHERLVDFPDPYAEPVVLSALRHKLWARRPGSRPPYVFRGGQPVFLPHDLPTAAGPTAYLGRFIDVPFSLAGFGLSGPGRHLAVLGPAELGADLLDAAARSLASQHEPGTVHFVLTRPPAAVQSLVDSLAADLRAAGHAVQTDVDGLGSGPYIIGFGLDGNDVEAWLAGGARMIGWWRSLRRFGEDTGGAAVDGLVLLNVPGADAAQLLGDAGADWQWRPNRALFHDRRDGRTVPILPFLHSGGSR